MNLGPMEISLILLAVLLLFGYKKLPDASRSLGRSLRIFKSEMNGLKDDDLRGGEVTAATPAHGEIVPPVATDRPQSSAGAAGTSRIDAQRDTVREPG